MNWPSLGGVFGGSDSVALPASLTALVEGLKGPASFIGVYRADRSIIDNGGSELKLGALVTTLHETSRNEKQLITDRTRDFKNAARALDAFGVKAQNTGRIASMTERREKFDGIDMPIVRERLATSDPHVRIETESIRGGSTAQFPETMRSRRMDLELEPTAITAMFEFGKNILVVRIGAPLKEMVKDYTQRVLSSLNRRNVVNPPMLAKVLDAHMTTKWTVKGDKIHIPDGAQAEAVHALSSIITQGSRPEPGDRAGTIKLKTAAGNFTIEGLQPAEMHAAMREPHVISSETQLALGREAGIGLGPA